MGELEPETSWETLCEDATAFDLGFANGPVRVISIVRLIAIKQKIGRPRDLAILPLLRAHLNRP